ncbi:hypothetical protein Vadar_023161 [Vaccinium darrowii]|uniref:Uncharacterized protein n=1 Tax=Vaccinium darrowii TaxID=229202 RepID=A0ACB7X334_9ERIC|nr:hypothetical protein Vadar_023161 [Vaccinium darrowii]
MNSLTVTSGHDGLTGLTGLKGDQCRNPSILHATLFAQVPSPFHHLDPPPSTFRASKIFCHVYDRQSPNPTSINEDAKEKALKNKLFEAVVPMIDTMGKALRIFGAMKVPTKRILKMMAELFDHEDVNVRTSSKVLTLELYEGIEIEPMKSMEKDLEGELVSLTGTPGPSHRIRSEEDNELEREGVSEVEGGSGSKESVTDAPLAIDDAVKILDNWKNKKFGDGVKATELAKLALTDGMAPGDFKEICSTLKEIMTCVVEHFGLRTTFVVEEGLDGFHIQSNDRSIPKKPITFNIHTPGEGAMIGKFLHHMGELIGWYNFIIGEEHLSMLIVPRIPSTPVIEEFKAWGESDVFMLDPLTTKATTIAPKFKILLRKIRSPMHKVLSQFGRYHRNVFQGLRMTNSGDVLLCLPDQSYGNLFAYQS